MRTNGTKYGPIAKLPKTAKPVSQYALEAKLAVGQIYMKYERYIHGYPNTGTKGPDPGYTIRCWNGMNFVIPQTVKNI